MPRIKVQTDRSLVSSTCVRLRTRRRDRYAWRDGWRIRFASYDRST